MVTKYNVQVFILILYSIIGSIMIIGAAITFEPGSSDDIRLFIAIGAAFIASIGFLYKVIRKRLEKYILDNLDTFLKAHRMHHVFKKYIEYDQCVEEDIPVFKVPKTDESIFRSNKYKTKYSGENYIKYQDRSLKTQFEKSEVNYILYKSKQNSSGNECVETLANFSGTLTIFTLDIAPVLDKIYFINNLYFNNFNYSEYKLEHEIKNEYGVFVYSTEKINVDKEFYDMFKEKRIKAMFFIKNKIMVLEDRLLFEMPHYFYMNSTRLDSLKFQYKREVYNIISFVDDYVFTRKNIRVIKENEEHDIYEKDISIISEDLSDFTSEIEVIK